MRDVAQFLDHMDWWGLLGLLISAVAALLCITIHEVCHGLAAYCLGDPTAKQAGRLTFNPIHHIDPFGLLMMIVARVGWAKPVPVDMRYFRHPRQGMALTALAGPASNFVLALAALGLSSLIASFAPVNPVTLVVLSFLSNMAVLSIGLGVFNLIPIPPLDGSKVLFSVLPDRFYLKLLHYERYIMLVLFALVMFGVFQEPLSNIIIWVLEKMCSLVNYPLSMVFTTQDLSYLLGILS